MTTSLFAEESKDSYGGRSNQILAIQFRQMPNANVSVPIGADEYSTWRQLDCVRVCPFGYSTGKGKLWNEKRVGNRSTTNGRCRGWPDGRGFTWGNAVHRRANSE